MDSDLPCFLFDFFIKNNSMQSNFLKPFMSGLHNGTFELNLNYLKKM